MQAKEGLLQKLSDCVFDMEDGKKRSGKGNFGRKRRR